MNDIVIAAKCAPKEKVLCDIKEAGLEAVELHLFAETLNNLPEAISTCKKFSLRYAIHAPNKGYNPAQLTNLAEAIGAEAVVFHNIYWEDEWEGVIKEFKSINTKLCVENTYSALEPIKFMRRFNMKRCLDLEHLQMETAGIFKEVFINLMGEASHVHLTGYVAGTKMWHTPIHYSPDHNTYLLDLLKESGYKGLVVSEAKQSFQGLSEFKALNEFYRNWIGR